MAVLMFLVLSRIHKKVNTWTDLRLKWTRARCYKNVSCKTQLSMKIFLLINVKMPAIVLHINVKIVGILTFMSGKNSILGLSEPEKCYIS